MCRRKKEQGPPYPGRVLLENAPHKYLRRLGIFSYGAHDGIYRGMVYAEVYEKYKTRYHSKKLMLEYSTYISITRIV
jgi:hypothetical protein